MKQVRTGITTDSQVLLSMRPLYASRACITSKTLHIGLVHAGTEVGTTNAFYQHAGPPTHKAVVRKIPLSGVHSWS